MTTASGRLWQKTAIITGGAGGIGIATARRFVEEGAQVLLVDLDESRLLQTQTDIASHALSTVAADVTREEDVRRYVETAVQRYGGIDIFINNAGIEGEVSRIPDYSVATFDKVIAVNVRGVWLGLKYVIPEMAKRNGGSIVVTSSVAGLKGTPGLSAYTASKHAVIGLVRTAALECASVNIRVNSVNPAPIETRMIHSLDDQFIPEDPEKARQIRQQKIPMQRYGDPQEVANLMLFLASDESSYCSGGVYTVDGAVSAG